MGNDSVRRLAASIAIVVGLLTGGARPAEAQQRGATIDPTVAEAISRGEKVIDWDGRGAIPPGYERSTRANRTLAWAGVASTSLGWLLVSAAAMGNGMTCEAFGGDQCLRGRELLLIPIAGPWLHLAMGEDRSVPGALLVGSGLLQAGGVALLIAGIADRQRVLRRRPGLVVFPVLTPAVQGAGVSGQF